MRLQSAKPIRLLADSEILVSAETAAKSNNHCAGCGSDDRIQARNRQQTAERCNFSAYQQPYGCAEQSRRRLLAGGKPMGSLAFTLSYAQAQTSLYTPSLFSE